MRTIQNTSRAGNGPATATLNGLTLERGTESSTGWAYTARVSVDGFNAFLASLGRNEPAPEALHATIDVDVTGKRTNDIRAFHASADEWVLSLPEKRARVLASEFGVPIQFGNADAPAFSG